VAKKNNDLELFYFRHRIREVLLGNKGDLDCQELEDLYLEWSGKRGYLQKEIDKNFEQAVNLYYDIRRIPKGSSTHQDVP